MPAPVVGSIEEAQRALDQAYDRIEQLEGDLQKIVKRLAAAGIA